MSRRPIGTSKARRWIEVFLLLTGVVALGIWGWSYVHRAVSESWANHVLDHRINARTAAGPTSPAAPPRLAWPPLPNGALIGRLAIPRLNVRAVVREGAGHDTLDIAAGHIPGTALPGQPGNVGVAGHRDTLFRGLRKIEKDDLIQFQTSAGTYNYKVETTSIVKPKDVAVLHPGQNPELTLVTCYPFYYVGSAPNRFIVKARLADSPALPAPDAKPDAKPDAFAAADARPSDPPRESNAPRPESRPVLSRDREGVVAPVPGVRRVNFRVIESHSRELVPGIRLGLSSANAARHQASLWMFVTPERHTISLKNQPAYQAVFFHGHDDGRQRALMITQVTAKSVSGYLLLYGANRTVAQSLRSQ